MPRGTGNISGATGGPSRDGATFGRPGTAPQLSTGSISTARRGHFALCLSTAIVIFGGMEIRPARAPDLDQLAEIDGTIESTRYLHVDRNGEGVGITWRLEERPLRSKLIERNPLDDDERFVLKQVLIGAEEGVALVAEHEGEIVGLAGAVVEPAAGTLRLVDVRVDFDYRREGLGSAMLYQCIQNARERELRAVAARVPTYNLPGAQFLAKASFELTGLDTHLQSNHDLVKEAVTLFWYLPLD